MAEIRPGQGIITRVGWEKDDDGKEYFRAIVKFPKGPPPLPWSVVFDALPIVISEAPKE